MFVAAAILAAGPAARAFQGFHNFGCTDEPTLLGPCDGGCYSFAGFRGFKADAGPYPTEHCVEVFSVPGCDPEDACRIRARRRAPPGALRPPRIESVRYTVDMAGLDLRNLALANSCDALASAGARSESSSALRIKYPTPLSAARRTSFRPRPRQLQDTVVSQQRLHGPHELRRRRESKRSAATRLECISIAALLDGIPVMGSRFSLNAFSATKPRLELAHSFLDGIPRSHRVRRPTEWMNGVA
ncbi:hypothetical protein AURDEDRAFT_163701 [Auricularia subglabra TFB-10046 SS5]|nr:hypothetical protein AURDEDRAFT_163701 [Auricularia subglabra TFB-10046 SS5]